MKIKQWPETLLGLYDQMDQRDIYKMPLTGLFQDGAETDEKEVSCLTYIPESARQSGPAVLVFPDEGETAEDCLYAGGWTDMADQHGVVVFAASGVTERGEAELLAGQMLNKKHYNVNKACCCLAGYGSGSRLVQQLIAAQPQRWAGAACIGGFEVEEAFLEREGAAPSDLAFVPKRQVPVPVWLWTEKLTEPQRAVLDYWKRAGRTEEEPYEKRGVRYYLPRRTETDALIDEQIGAEVLLTEREGCVKAYPGQAELLWTEFFSKTVRYVGIANGNLRPERTLEQWGCRLETIEVDGYTRELYLYVPEREKPEEKLPLVVCFHGGSNIGLRAIGQTNWIKIAKARRFAAVFPSGTLRRLDEKGSIPHPAWNANGDPRLMDDVKFIEEMLKKLIAEYPIDRERIYATGHSMGAAMCQRILLTLPEYFAAGATTGGLLKGGNLGNYDSPGVREIGKIPLWIILGENDIDKGPLKENPAAVRNLEYWTARNETGGVWEAAEYRTGLYRHKVYRDEHGNPLVRFSMVDYRPHCSIPQDAWFFYDQWFSMFRKEENGRLYCMEQPV